MKTNLIVTDPLAGQEVSILVTVAAGEEDGVCLPRDGRPSLISVGVAGQMPISRSGTLGDVVALIHEAWAAFGVQAEMNEQAAKTATSAQLSTGVSQETTTSARLSTGVAEEIIAETTVATDEADALPPTISATKPIAPKPAISKLSLF